VKRANNNPNNQRQLIVVAELSFFFLALVSLGYSVMTAPGQGRDLAMFQEMGRAWLSGTYQMGEGQFYGPPPFASVLFSPLGIFSPVQARIVLIAVNLITTAIIILLIKKLWGDTWPAKAPLYLAALLLCWAPFRVTVRNGQISLIVTALLLGALLEWKRGAKILAGLLLGLSLCKYPLTLPFALYFVWRREWKIVAAAVLTVAALTEVFALRLGLSLPGVTVDYVRMMMLSMSIHNDWHFVGATEIGPLLRGLTGSEHFGRALNGLVTAVGLAAMAFTFWRRRRSEKFHLAIITFFSLWFVYHRIYDAVICVIPAAVFADLIIRDKHRKFGVACLAALALFAISIPGLLTERLHLSVESLSANPAGFVGVHFERVLVFGMFWLLLVLLWKFRPGVLKDLPANSAIDDDRPKISVRRWE
jgi:hypothetical protein